MIDNIYWLLAYNNVIGYWQMENECRAKGNAQCVEIRLKDGWFGRALHIYCTDSTMDVSSTAS